MDPLPSLSLVLDKLAALGVEVPAGRLRVDGYGDSPELSASLLALIRQGRKRAGTSLLWAVEFDNGAVPRVGDVEVVVDHRNEPALIARITDVRVLPFDAVAAEYAAIEGEGDGSLAYWREAHRAFFGRECERIGRQPVESMPVVCSIFEVVADLQPTRR